MSLGVMASNPVQSGTVDRASGASPAVIPGIAAGDLAEILSRFNAASEALQETHERLQGEVVRLQGELRDANEQLQRSRRLAALGEMAAGIAHEIRNPLASIALDAKMLERDAGDRDEPRIAAERIGGAVRRLNQVVGDVLGFAREMTPQVMACDSGELLERVERECGPLACAAGVAMESAGGPAVWCDPDLAHRAVANLVRNAIEAIAESAPGSGGAVRLGTRIAERDGRRWGVVRVSDDGPGIDAGVIDRMFNPFFTTRAAGTGLGLAIVHRIMDAHGGHVMAMNNSGAATDGGVPGSSRRPGRAGATFELHFPEPGTRGRGRPLPKEKVR